MRAVWRRQGVLRAVSILAVSAVIAAIISFMGTIRDLLSCGISDRALRLLMGHDR